jgi:hypothetical protein
MATAAQWRKLALSLPETEEKSHFEQPDFRVSGKIFAGLSKDEKTASIKMTPTVQSSLLDPDDDEAAFYPAAGAWGVKGWTHVRLAKVDNLEVLETLLKEAWELVAPKKLIAAQTKSTPTPKKTKAKAKAKKTVVTKTKAKKKTATKRKSASRK